MKVGENWRTRRKNPQTPQENAKNPHSQHPHLKNIYISCLLIFFNQSTYWHIVHKAIKCVGKLKKPERNHYGHYEKLPTDSNQGQLILTNLPLGVLIINGETWRLKRTGEPVGNLHRHH